jgi:hypothetical protein
VGAEPGFGRAERELIVAAVAYFPNKWGALKHAVRAAKAKGRARVAVLQSDGAVCLSRDYASPDPAGRPPEVP